MTVKDLAEELRIKPGTLYAWAAQARIPCIKIHGVIRFERKSIDEWLKGFVCSTETHKSVIQRHGRGESVEALIARAKRTVYSSARGNQTNSEPK